MAFAYAFFHRVSPSVMYDHLMADFAASAAVVGNLAACYFYAYAAMQLPVGLMVDRWGARRLLISAVLTAALGSLVFGLASSLPLAYAARLLIGAGSGIVFVATLKLASLHLPPRRFALATGLTMAVAMTGAVGGQAPLAALVEAIGWRQAMYVGAGLGAALALLIWLLARPPSAPTAAAHSQSTGHSVGAALRVVLGNPQTWLAGLFSGLMSGPMLSFGVLWAVPYLMQVQGLGRAEAGAGASLMLVGWAFGAPGFGWLSDRVGRRKPVMLATAAATLLGWLALIGPETVPVGLALALILLLGVTSSTMALSFAVSRELNPPAHSGLATSFPNFTSMVAAAILQPFVGWLLDLGWDGRMEAGARLFDVTAFRLAFLPYPIITAIVLVATCFMAETYCRQRTA
ncbi:MAG: MFS transporter [Alphaproteobacteria bacterium]|nr:MFS transporter [Alphaproteobacteria bacterium]